jgi:hypothetical protein
VELQEISLTCFLTVIKGSVSFYAIMDDLFLSWVFLFADDVEHEWEVQEEHWNTNDFLKWIDVP